MRFGKADGGGGHTRRKGKYPTEAQSTAGPTEEDSRQSHMSRCGLQQRCATMLERLHGRGGRPSGDVGAALAAEAVGQWTQLEEQPSRGRGPSVAFSLPLPLLTLAVNDSRGRFHARRGYLDGQFPVPLTFPVGAWSTSHGATLLLAPFPATGVCPTPFTPRRRLIL
ncbi:hypothetical protein SORBI_3001G415750 [Sorghum bicolor]|uniref:Uncharacterized protein n=1 Tax=Sorghum bicolor TaxID=4558 RepID=A0A1Z5SA53_SORBI|nr:hypothetical protein SORBI_3001G415750 [Sorghum bicolor]